MDNLMVTSISFVSHIYRQRVHNQILVQKTNDHKSYVEVLSILIIILFYSLLLFIF